MKVVSLFSGCGGLDLGFEKAGFNVVWANEYDSTIHQTYRLNHPHTELNTTDIRNLTSQEIPDCDGIIGGPPCQSWSLGGKSLGLGDERGKLVFDYIRIVKEKKPKFFVMENVPGMVTPRHLDAFNKFLDLFREAGYIIKYELMNAADYKVPQDRLRVIIVGIRSDLNVEYIFPAKLDSSPIPLSKAIGDIKEAPVPYNDAQIVSTETSLPNHDYYVGPFDHKFMARNRVRNWDELSFTIQAQAKNEPLHPQAPKMIFVSPNERRFVKDKEHLYRRLSVRECARIQSFPDSFKFVYERITDGYKMVGNAVPPRFAYHIALSINNCFSSYHSSKMIDLALIGYVKNKSDFSIIRNAGVYYIRGGSRPGALQYAQINKPIKWLLLHSKDEKALFELSGTTERCNKEYLERLGFKPNGNDYWFFKIRNEVKDNKMMPHIMSFVKEFKPHPQIVVINIINSHC